MPKSLPVAPEIGCDNPFKLGLGSALIEAQMLIHPQSKWVSISNSQGHTQVSGHGIQVVSKSDFVTLRISI